MKSPAVVLALLAASAQLAGAQTSVRNVNWQPWFGCWQASGSSDDEMLCVVADGSAVRMVTLVDGQVRADTRVLADGQSRRTSQDGCVNEESARWSRDHRRVFMASEVTCPGGVTRNVRGMLAFVSPDEWLSVQTVSSNDGTATRTVRFSPVQGLRIPGTIAGALRNSAMTRVAFIDDVDEADVFEAAEYIDAGAIDEWMRVADAPYRLEEGGSRVSALDQVGRLSQEVRYVDRTVVHVIERPVYVMRSYGRRDYVSCWTPWGYDHYGWRSAGPYIRIRYPIVINIGSRGHRYDYDNRWRSNDRDRYDRDSRDSRYNHDDRYDRSRDGRVTREGYTRSGETRQEPARTTVNRGSTTSRSASPGRTATPSRDAAPSRSSTTRSSQPRQAPVAASVSSGRTAQRRN